MKSKLLDLNYLFFPYIKKFKKKCFIFALIKGCIKLGQNQVQINLGNTMPLASANILANNKKEGS